MRSISDRMNALLEADYRFGMSRKVDAEQGMKGVLRDLTKKADAVEKAEAALKSLPKERIWGVLRWPEQDRARGEELEDAARAAASAFWDAVAAAKNAAVEYFRNEVQDESADPPIQGDIPSRSFFVGVKGKPGYRQWKY